MSIRVEQRGPERHSAPERSGSTPLSGAQRRTARGSRLSIALIAQREIVTQLRRREFWGSLIIMGIIVIASVGSQALFGQSPQSYVVAVVDAPADRDRQNLLTALETQTVSGGGTLAVGTTPSDTDAEARVRGREVHAAVLADGSAIYLDSLPDPLEEALRAATANAATRSALIRQGLNETQVSDALSVQPLRQRALDPNAQRNNERTVIAVIGIVAVFFLMFSFGQIIAQGVLEEKSSRIVEVMLAKVRATQLLTGKVLGLGVAVLTQILFLVVAGFITALALDLIAAPTDAIEVGLFVLLWFVPGYVLFATFWALAGALVSRQEDVANAAGPVSFLMTIGLLGALFPFSGVAPALSTALSVVPGFSWSMMPVRMAREVVPWWQTGIAIGLLVLAIAVLLRVAGRIYVGGLLNTGGLLTARAALRSAKESGLT